MWRPAGVWRRYAVVGRGGYLGALGVWVLIGHVWGHVAVILVVMSTCPAAFLVHVGVVRVWRRHRVEVVRGVVRSSSFTWTRRPIGRGNAHLVQATEHVSLHLEGHGGSAVVLVHQLHGRGVVIHVVGHRRRILRVKLHVGQGRDPRWGRGLEGVARRRRRG